MNAVNLLEIPYRENALDYLEALLEQPYPVLFDSGRPTSPQGRYDIFTSTPLYTLSYHQGIFQHSLNGAEAMEGKALLSRLNALLQSIRLASTPLPDIELPFYGGLAGYLAYDLGRSWEILPDISRRDIDLPELLMAYYPWAGVLDHQQQKAYVSFLPDCPAMQQAIILEALLAPKNAQNKLKKFNIINKLKSIINVNSYIEKVVKIQNYILSGDCYQVNLSQRFTGSYGGHPWLAYRQAREYMAAPFGSYFQLDSNKMGAVNAILSFSPERFLSLTEKKVLTQPIKGTIKRQVMNATLDAEAARQLLASEKNRAENLMIVDLLRNDLGKCCEYGSVITQKLFELQSVSNVHHLVSSINAQLKSGMTAFDLLQATIPGGSITGAPKIRAMEIIEELEPCRRSVYCGSMVYININGNMDSSIIIRTALCHQGNIHCWGGGGIVADSVAEEEYAESIVKIAPLINVFNSL